MQQQMYGAMPQGEGANAYPAAAPATGRGNVSHHRLGPLLGLAVAVGLMVLSLSAFVVGSNAGGGGAGILVGQPAANFSARDLAGERRTLREFRNQHILLVFGAAADLATADFTGALLPDSGRILLLSTDVDRDSSLQSVDSRAMFLRDEGGMVAEQYGVWSGAETASAQAVLISDSGEILDRGPLGEVVGPGQAWAIR